ncbi:response regulator [Patescibacteria group bacterium]|nr:response regulator [Patescibacteria group bacterium]
MEDDTGVREAALRMLTRLGHTVVAVDKAELALIELGRGTFDLILTDDDTGSDMRGRDVVKKIRSDPFFREIMHIPIIIQSGNITEQEVCALKAVFLPKPWGVQQLRDALDAAVLEQTGSLFR